MSDQYQQISMSEPADESQQLHSCKQLCETAHAITSRAFPSIYFAQIYPAKMIFLLCSVWMQENV